MDLNKQGWEQLYIDNNAFIAENEHSETFKEFAAKNDLVTIGNGVYCPAANAQKLIDQLIDFRQKYISDDRENNTDDEIIYRELKRFGAFETGNLREAHQVLAMYNFTVEQISKVYVEHSKK